METHVNTREQTDRQTDRQTGARTEAQQTQRSVNKTSASSVFVQKVHLLPTQTTAADHKDKSGNNGKEKKY